jgi:hypothetical protein
LPDPAKQRAAPANNITYFYAMKIRTLVILLLFIACKSKKKNTEADAGGSFPVLALIKSQVANVDTSIYTITMTEKKDSLDGDTVFLKREEFREAAKDFLSIPDISSAKYKDDYTETKDFMQDLGLVVLEYAAKDADAEIRKEQVYIEPGTEGEDKVDRIIIDKVYKEKNAIVHKNMVWKINSHFQVATSTEEPGKPEQTTIRTVRWKTGFSQ